MWSRPADPHTCEKCPHRFDGRGCPAWVNAESGFMETNPSTQETRPVTGCFYQVIPRLMAHVVAAANRPASIIQDMRSDIVEGMRGVARAIGLSSPAGPLLEHRDGEERE